MNTAAQSAPSSTESPSTLPYSATLGKVSNQRELISANAGASNPDSSSAFTRFRPSPLVTSSATSSPPLTNPVSTPRNVQATSSSNEALAPSALRSSASLAVPLNKTAIPIQRPVTVVRSMHTTTTGVLTTKGMPSQPMTTPSRPTCNVSSVQQLGVPSTTVVRAVPSSIQRTPSSLPSKRAHATTGTIKLTENNVSKLIDSNHVAVNVASAHRQLHHSNFEQNRMGHTIHAASLNHTNPRLPSQDTTHDRPNNKAHINSSRLSTSFQTTIQASGQPSSHAMQAISVQRASSTTINATPSKSDHMVNNIRGQSVINHKANNVASKRNEFLTLSGSAPKSTATVKDPSRFPNVANAARKPSVTSSTQFYLVPTSNGMGAANARSGRAIPSGGVGPGKHVPHLVRPSQDHNQVQHDVKMVVRTPTANASSGQVSRFINALPTAPTGRLHGSRRAQNTAVQAVINTSNIGTQIMRGKSTLPPDLFAAKSPVTNPSQTKGEKNAKHNLVPSRLQNSTAPQSSAKSVTTVGRKRLPLHEPRRASRALESTPNLKNTTSTVGATKSSFSRMRTAATTKNQGTLKHGDPAVQVRGLANSRAMTVAKGVTNRVNTGNGGLLTETNSQNMRGRSPLEAKDMSRKLSTGMSTPRLTPTKRPPSISPEVLAASVKRSVPSPTVPKEFASARSPASVTHSYKAQHGIENSTAAPAGLRKPVAVLPEMQSVDKPRTPIGTRLKDMEHVKVWNRVEKRKIAGNAAPLRKNIERYLREHQDCEVYTGQDISAKQERKASGLHSPSELSAGDHVTVWNRVDNRKIAGNAAPLMKNLDAYLQKNPNCEVYNFQDRQREDRGTRIQVHSKENMRIQNPREQYPSQNHNLSANELSRSAPSHTQDRIRHVRQYESHVLSQTHEVPTAHLSQTPVPFFDLEKFISFENDEDLKHCVEFYDGTLPPLLGCLEIPN